MIERQEIQTRRERRSERRRRRGHWQGSERRYSDKQKTKLMLPFARAFVGIEPQSHNRNDGRWPFSSHEGQT
jgi:hypothetical protein